MYSIFYEMKDKILRIFCDKNSTFESSWFGWDEAVFATTIQVIEEITIRENKSFALLCDKTARHLAVTIGLYKLKREP